MATTLKLKYRIGRTYKAQKCSRSGNNGPHKEKHSRNKKPFVSTRILTYTDGKWRMEAR